MSHMYFQVLLILLLSFEVSSHLEGKMLYILSDFIMNYAFVSALGFALLALGLVFFLVIVWQLLVWHWSTFLALWLSKNVSFVTNQYFCSGSGLLMSRVQNIFINVNKCTVSPYSWTIPSLLGWITRQEKIYIIMIIIRLVKTNNNSNFGSTSGQYFMQYFI